MRNLYVLAGFVLYAFSCTVSGQSPFTTADEKIASPDSNTATCQHCPEECHLPVAPNNAPPSIAIVQGWRYRGCWTDDPRQRTLTGKRIKSPTMTVERCAQLCRGYRFFGVEYSSECYCGNTASQKTKQQADTMCDRACIADFSHVCGGQNSLSLYESEEAPQPSTK